MKELRNDERTCGNVCDVHIIVIPIKIREYAADS